MDKMCKICGTKLFPISINGKDVYSSICKKCFLTKCKKLLDKNKSRIQGE